MTEFIQLIFIASLWIWGVFAVFDEGHLLHGVRKLMEATIGTYWCKPIVCCPICMASLHGGIIALFHYGFDYRVIGIMLCVCGLNFIIKEYLYP